MTLTSPSACLRFVQRICRSFQSISGHDAVTIPQLKINSARPGFVAATFTIGKHNLNRLGSLHGGCIATLTDTMGSLAIASKGLYSTGVSTDINTTYVKAAGTAGTTINVQAHLISMGKTLAFTRVELLHQDSGQLLAYGSHTKYIKAAMRDAENVTFDPDGQNVVEGKQPQEWK
ncbi:thioesterase/thiol ester dehydrase-isomerase [Moesziomyces antarcticus]|uniref:Thioesterase/thiol ester dehydrase-isomerase n=2 Tax=Pseudozyma antarctica TaxID=84753 RepID=A0A081CIB3_PSEA2|nr:thioesterase/thiol ester dehydrase-isomerase [Moesziomyces antarcticus]GAK66409.1 thioesterase/thiol ester dehydrase-isomerase [Moesziomyces antarcticus]SPO47448.1 related to Putative esterase C31F10.02 [Moesziomyces antarcticus]